MAVPGLLVVAAVLALWIDCPLAQWFLAGNCPRLLAKLFDLAEVFGHGLGVAGILVVIHQLDPLRRWALPRLLVCAASAGLAADLIKLLVVRVRPRYFDFCGNVADTFGSWLPLLSVNSGQQSFPSGHVAAATGLALGLAWVYPRGRWLFAALAVLVAFQRMEVGAHYLSDVLFGAAAGYVAARTFLQPSACTWPLACLERLWKQRLAKRFPQYFEPLSPDRPMG